MFDTLTEPFLAAVDLVGRTGARGLEFGYLHDGVPASEADWYAHAQYQGARIIEEHHAGPVEAVEALARRLLTGGRCKCGRLVALDDEGAFAFFKAHTVDGKPWNIGTSGKAGMCHWRRHGPRWRSGCEGPRADK